MDDGATPHGAPRLFAHRDPVRSWSWVALGLGALLTALVVGGVVDFEYRNAAAHVALETLDVCVALLVSYLV